MMAGGRRRDASYGVARDSNPRFNNCGEGARVNPLDLGLARARGWGADADDGPLAARGPR